MKTQLTRRKLNNRIRCSEVKFAIELAKGKWNRKLLERELEWLVTWAIKKSNSKEPLWCGGAKILELSRLQNKYLIIAAIVHIGSEFDEKNRLCEARLEGRISLNGHRNKLKSYLLIIDQGENMYEIQKHA